MILFFNVYFFNEKWSLTSITFCLNRLVPCQNKWLKFQGFSLHFSGVPKCCFHKLCCYSKRFLSKWIKLIAAHHLLTAAQTERRQSALVNLYSLPLAFSNSYFPVCVPDWKWGSFLQEPQGSINYLLSRLRFFLDTRGSLCQVTSSMWHYWVFFFFFLM